jgi:hypothetical protein
VAGQGREEYFQRQRRLLSAEHALGQASLLRLFISLFTIPQSQTNTNGHESDRRNKQNYDSASNRVLTFFVKSTRRAIAHGAALREGGSRPKREQQAQDSKA